MSTASSCTLNQDEALRRRQTVFLLGHDRHLGWTALEATLARMRGVEVIGRVRELDAAPGLLTRLRPALVVIAVQNDAQLAGGLAMVEACSPTSRVVLVADEPTGAMRAAQARAPIAGCLIWLDLSDEGLEASLEAVLTGSTVYSRTATALLRAESTQRLEAPERRETLTADELTVLCALCRGLRQKEIAAEVQLSVRTVSRTVTTLQRKLGVRSPAELGARATELGLLQSPEAADVVAS